MSTEHFKRLNSPVIRKRDFIGEAVVVGDGAARYSVKERLLIQTNLGGTAERQASFVPDVDEGFFVYIICHCEPRSGEAISQHLKDRDYR